MTAKKIIGKIHLWLGLSSGLVVFIVAVTGCIFCFEEELFNIFHRKLVYCEMPANNTTVLPVSALKDAAEKALGEKINALNIYSEKNRAAEFEVFRYDEKEAAKGIWATAGEYWKRVYVNPYNGQVNGIIDLKYEFFLTVRAIHQHLYLNSGIGSIIVGTSTIIFIVLLISGMVLWWPRNKAAAKQRFAFRWKSSTQWKRKNYDLHNILGFYMLLFGLFIALTGIVWSFDWWEKIVYRMIDGKVIEFELPQNPHPVVVTSASADIIEKVTAEMKHKRPQYHRIYLSGNEENNTLTAAVEFKDNKLWTPYDYHQYELSTGKEFGQLLHKDKTTGQKWRNSNYDLHTGKSLGYAGMIIAFFTSFIIASLPVTGFYIWWGRRKKIMPVKK